MRIETRPTFTGRRPPPGPERPVARAAGLRGTESRADSVRAPELSDETVCDALAAADVGAWVWHPGGDLIQADATARRLWGLALRGQIRPAGLLHQVHHDNVPDLRAAAEQAKEGGECHVTLRVRHGGAERWLRVRGRRRPGVEPPQVAGVVLDVTERMRAEARHEALQERLRRAQELGGALPFEWDAGADRVVASPAYKALFGLDPEAEFSLPVLLALVHPADRDRVAADQERLIADPGPFESEFRILLPDGRERWLLSRGESLSDALGRATGLAGVTLDISHRKEVEEELRRSRREARARFRELKALYQNAPVGLALLDRDFRYLRLNQRLAALTGGDAQAPAAAALFDFAPQLRDTLEPVLRGVLASAQAATDVEVAYAPATGGPARAFNCHFYPLKDGAGGVAGIGVVVEDVTAHKDATEARDVLSRELSHRIKNLFAVVSSLVSLSTRGEPALQDFARALRERIEALGRAHDYVRPCEWDPEAARPARTLRGLLASLFSAYGDRVEVEGADLAVGARAATTLALALHELATNAAKYGALSQPGGGVRVRCAVADSRMTLRWEERGGPRLPGPPQRSGFGTRLARRSITGDLEGTLDLDWATEGLVARIEAPLERLDL